MHNNPTLGEVAYNAYCTLRDWKAFNGDPLPPFAELLSTKPDIAKGWETAAQAVIDATTFQPRWLFAAGDIVQHRKGSFYVITHGRGDNVRIEATGEYAYVYGFQGPSPDPITYWVRPAREMEDGRFVLIAHNDGKP